jgi:hypothetical protein
MSTEQLLPEWLRRLTDLIEDIKVWAEGLGWTTRKLEITLTDSVLGRYKAPALIMQDDNVKILVEPIARSAPGAEGVVDIYLMPELDDIASLYFYENAWRLHYLFPEKPVVETIRDGESRPLSLESLRYVLEAMKEHALQ